MNNEEPIPLTIKKTQPLAGQVCVCGDIVAPADDCHRLHIAEYAEAFERYMLTAEVAMAVWEADAKARWSR